MGDSFVRLSFDNKQINGVQFRYGFSGRRGAHHTYVLCFLIHNAQHATPSASRNATRKMQYPLSYDLCVCKRCFAGESSKLTHIKLLLMQTTQKLDFIVSKKRANFKSSRQVNWGSTFVTRQYNMELKKYVLLSTYFSKSGFTSRPHSHIHSL